MNMEARLSWSRKMAELNESLERLQADHGQFDAALAEMRAYSVLRPAHDEIICRNMKQR